MYLFFPFLQHGVREVSNYLSNVLEINWTYRTVLNKNYLILRYVNFEYVLVAAVDNADILANAILSAFVNGIESDVMSKYHSTISAH
jgi:hypothetical protein